MIGILKTNTHVKYFKYFKNNEQSMFFCVFSLTKFII